MIDQNNKQLSPGGEARKNKMLSQLVGQMNHIHNTRRVRRRVIQTFTLVVVCVITVWVVSLKYSKPQPNDFVIVHSPNIEQPPRPQITTLIKTINDDELIALLAEIDRPTGLIRSEGRIWLTNPVTDEELRISHETIDEDPSSM